MSEMTVIADASPLIALARIRHLHLLQALFGEVMLTDVVAQEVLSGGDFADAEPVRAAIGIGWLKVTPYNTSATTPTTLTAYLEGLDPGETSSIFWAAELQQAGKSPLLIMDEAKGRAVARSLALEVMGSAGVIAIAKRSGLIPRARPLLESLRASGYYLSQTVIDAALKIAKE
ncbi:MAG: DUF3368 domain-containing protein [Thiothrix sp.]|uniref:DUF3368 domain-containing protein n=1 Tax=Thiothrix sp. TaxID=1032 RepID=UPI00263766D4|nr:DUF3368 domain-containing protein [Thiothrix sp.]MDD5394274.1 DUF3368 domain-containing protein [Thiothrix sp.]